MENENKDLGLSLNKKTVGAICAVLALILVLIGALTQILPRGEYQTAVQDGHTVIVDGTYTETRDYKMPIWKIALSPILCFGSEQAATGIGIIAIIIFVKTGILSGAPVEMTWTQGLSILAAALPMAIVGYFSAIYQGRVSASGVSLIAKKPTELVKGMTMAALVEFYAVLALLVSFIAVNNVNLG